jgi:hypothetical protein
MRNNLCVLIAKYSPQVLHASSGVTRGRGNACTNGGATHVARVKSLRNLLKKAQVCGDCRRERIELLAKCHRHRCKSDIAADAGLNNWSPTIIAKTAAIIKVTHHPATVFGPS